MKVDFAFICDYAVATGKINALGIGFDTIRAKQVPYRHPHFSLVLQIRASAVEVGNKSVTIHLIDEDGQEVVPVIQSQAEIQKPEGRPDSIGRFVIEFGMVEFKRYGSYSVRVAIEGMEVAEVPFAIVQPPAKP